MHGLGRSQFRADSQALERIFGELEEDILGSRGGPSLLGDIFVRSMRIREKDTDATMPAKIIGKNTNGTLQIEGPGSFTDDGPLNLL